MQYRGRFAPSPTGALHFGSLVAAVASYADALAHQGCWLVRMEDIDEKRTVAGAADEILRSLEAFGFEWDETVLHQSRRKERYGEIIQQLLVQDLAYSCACSRKEIAAIARSGIEGPIYPNTCRNGPPTGRQGRALRLRTTSEEIGFEDRIQGSVYQRLEQEIGDFIIHRADGFTAYQLAVVVDDADQEINQIVRGADLLLSTPRQIYLQQLLGHPQPAYAHIPLVLDAGGRKLSKQDRDHPVSRQKPLDALLAAWRFLAQPMPPEPPLHPEEFWNWAKETWHTDRIRRSGP